MFNNATRQSFIPLNQIRYSAGGSESLQLPPVGFLSKIIVMVSATLTTNNAGTYTAVEQGPNSIIKRVRLHTNEGAEVYNLSGEGAYLMSRIIRSQYDYRNPAPSFASTATAPHVYYYPSTLAVSTTTTVRFPIHIPVAWGEQLQAGLILLQNQISRMQLELTFGDALTDLYTAAGGGAITVGAVTIKPLMEIFNVPDNAQDYPDISTVMITLEENQPVTSTGDFQYRPLLGLEYLDIIQEFTNNGVRMTPDNFSKLQLVYAQTQNAYTVDIQTQLYIQRYRLGGIDLPDGVFWWSFGMGTGLPEIGNTRDVIDTGRVTDLQLNTHIGEAVVLTNAKVKSIRRMLSEVAR